MKEKHLLNREFDKVVCINLAERPDKKEKMKKKFFELGIEVEWFTAVQYGFVSKLVPKIVDAGIAHFNKETPNEMGCAMSHYSVIKQALLEGVDELFVFEDDARFHKDFNTKLDSYWDALPDLGPNNWDMISFYSFMYQLLPQNTRVSKRWMKSYKSWSLMAYGMKRPIMEDYIKRQDNFLTMSDMVPYQMQEENKWNIYSAVPALCIPETGLGSNIRGTNMNYKNNPTITNMGYSDDNYE